MPAKEPSNRPDPATQQRAGKGQVTDPRTGRDEDDRVVTPPRTGSVYEEDADGMTTQPEQPYDALLPEQSKRPK